MHTQISRATLVLLKSGPRCEPFPDPPRSGKQVLLNFAFFRGFYLKFKFLKFFYLNINIVFAARLKMETINISSLGLSDLDASLH